MPINSSAAFLRAHQRKDFLQSARYPFAIDHMAPLTLQLLWRKRQFH